MSEQRQIVVLALEVGSPVDFWNWHELLDLNGNESVKVLAVGYEKKDDE